MEIFGKRIKEEHKCREKDFTRQRVFSFARLIMFQINISTKSLTIELMRFFTRIENNEESKSYSKQSYSEARMKMRHTAYIELNEILVREYYQKDDYKKYKGYRLLAIDGSKIRLPNNEELKKEYGTAKNGEAEIAMAMSSAAYDVLNKITVNTYLERCEKDERSMAEKQIEKIQEITPGIKDILILDRGYPAIYFFAEMLHKGYDFVVRCTEDGFMKEARGFAKGEERECKIMINLKGRTRSTPKLKAYIEKSGQDQIEIRMVKIKLKTGKEEYLITSLLDENKFTGKDLEEIYHLRWNEETYFDFQKNVMEIENFSGRSPETIRQDFYARILSSNLGTLIIEDAQEEVDKRLSGDKELKYEAYKINRSVALGLMKDELIEMLLLPNKKWGKRYNKLVDKVKRFTVPIIPERSIPREKKYHGKFYLRKRKVF